MAWMENVPGVVTATGVAGLGLKWVLDSWKDAQRERRGEESESVALKTLRREVMRLTARVDALENDVVERESAILRLNLALDVERKARRDVEDDLDIERHAKRNLEQRLAKWEPQP